MEERDNERERKVSARAPTRPKEEEVKVGTGKVPIQRLKLDEDFDYTKIKQSRVLVGDLNSDPSAKPMTIDELVNKTPSDKERYPVVAEPPCGSFCTLF